MNLIRFKEKVPSKLLFPLINTLSSASFAFVKTLQVFFFPPNLESLFEKLHQIVVIVFCIYIYF